MTKNNELTIGIIYNFSTKWMGGVIYILNVIKILNWLDEDSKPKIILFYRKDLKRFVDEISYPYLEAVEWDFREPKRTYIKSWLCGKNLFIHDFIKKFNLDVIFPMHDYPVHNSVYPSIKQVSWYADLQHKHYPEFFSKKKVFERDARIKLILKNSDHLVVSSEAVKKDFIKYFNINSQDITTHIFRFASVVDDFDFSQWDKIRSNHGLPSKYFMVSNQFHKHKNHKAIFEALGLLKKRKFEPKVAITGRMPDSKTSEYVKDLHSSIEKYGLHNQVVFLGVLTRHDQLTLMRYAQAVLQPSLFEGWSTVIEDSISLQTPVISSNLDVNIEQLGNWSNFFDPFNYKELAELMENSWDRNDFDKVLYEPYNTRIKNAAETLVDIFRN